MITVIWKHNLKAFHLQNGGTLKRVKNITFVELESCFAGSKLSEWLLLYKSIICYMTAFILLRKRGKLYIKAKSCHQDL